MKTGFGWVEVGEKRYDHDIIIHTDGSISRRKKRASKELKSDYGHTPLSEYELEFLCDERPGVVYIGTGQYGSLPLTPTILKPTGDILLSLDREERSHVAILHVTC